ncbi:MAG: 30S ribosomal protein S2 [Candidatus Neomarinimicrobiota bacterium]
MPSSSLVTVENLISTGAHFGHLTRRWHPNYKPYVYMEKNGIHIIDIQQTIQCIHRATEAVAKIVQDGGTLLFVGTKKQARDVLQSEADRCGMYYVVERWLGGTLTNFATIKRSIKRLQQLEKDADTLYQTLTKKEILHLERERIRLADQHRGIKDMKQLPDAMYVVDAQYEETAIKEARRLEIPIIAIVDTNSDPTLVDYPIPANDDSLRTIQLITSAIADAIIAARGGQSFEAAEETETEPEAVAAESAAGEEEEVKEEKADLDKEKA